MRLFRVRGHGFIHQPGFRRRSHGATVCDRLCDRVSFLQTVHLGSRFRFLRARYCLGQRNRVRHQYCCRGNASSKMSFFEIARCLRQSVLK
jgi:hypothetical protein